MLQALSIRDVAIIEALDLELDSGLTVITGETGAGKSVLINALGLVLGDRARAEVVRTGAEQAQVQALFDLRKAPEVAARLTEAGIEHEGELVVRRVVTSSGRSRAWLNGTLATLAMLGRVTEGLVDISGQHEHYSLLKADTHLDLLDRVGGLNAPREAVAQAHQQVASLDARIADLQARQRDRAEREAFLRFQLDELEQAELSDPEEEDTLEQEGERLRNAERLREAAARVEHELYTAKGAAAERLQKAIDSVELLARYDDSLKPLIDDLQSALAIAEDAGRTLGHYGRDLDAEPERLEQVEARLTLFSRLRRKYGATLGEVIERMQAMRAELDELGDSDDSLRRMTEARKEAARGLRAAAETLTAARRAAGNQLAAAVCRELADLGMGGATLVVGLTPLTAGVDVGRGMHVGPRGADRVELRLSANPGETPGPLERIASGGELSRFMLAVKQVIAARDPVPVYIFDEVDTGVGGPTAGAIGAKLRAVSQQRQALCITHLPQIAAMGDAHLHVSKETFEGRTRSVVTRLDQKGRVEELARMLGGATITKATRANARELLTQGRRTLL
ncbi:MAG: DNA repair protein RecN [Myxococcales bacterium]|nr:DNA repair protein RecN [Myxococcales bacterium]